jgi:DNA polymerase III sliding clamp (beta) subunit (PCNA family)
MKLINSINKVKSQDETRNAISKIYLDSVNQKIVATDGSCMTVLEPSEPITKSICLDVPKISGKELDIDMTSFVATNEKGLSVQCMLVEGATFPDWSKVLPDKIEHTFYLDAELLQKVVESLSASKDTMIKIELGNGYTPVRVSNAVNDNYGVIMPLHADRFNEIKDRNKNFKSRIEKARKEFNTN